jgi:integrase
MASLALEFLILTAARTSEVLDARWEEFDLDKKLWTVPADRMKAHCEHRVPLCSRALAIVAMLAKAKTGAFVFPSRHRLDKPMSTSALATVLQRLKVDATVHGFRSSFRDWAGEETTFAREIAEASLAYVVGDAAEQAYRRSILVWFVWGFFMALG